MKRRIQWEGGPVREQPSRLQIFEEDNRRLEAENQALKKKLEVFEASDRDLRKAVHALECEIKSLTKHVKELQAKNKKLENLEGKSWDKAQDEIISLKETKKELEFNLKYRKIIFDNYWDKLKYREMYE